MAAFLCKLDAAPVGILTYGLAFHPEYTSVLRYLPARVFLHFFYNIKTMPCIVKVDLF